MSRGNDTPFTLYANRSKQGCIHLTSIVVLYLKLVPPNDSSTSM